MVGICRILSLSFKRSLGLPKTEGVLFRKMREILQTEESQSQRQKMLWLGLANLPTKRQKVHQEKENENIALAWTWASKFATKGTIFDKIFSLLGVGESEESPLLLKEGQNVFKFHASGRRFCPGTPAAMELKSRHYLISRLYNMVVPRKDGLYPTVPPALFTPRNFSSAASTHTHIDWRDKNVLTRVRNQRGRNCCYAMAAICSVEAIWKIKKRVPRRLSVQELIDCSRPFGNSGCREGEVVSCYNYIRFRGISAEADYPYSGYEGHCDERKRRYLAAYINGFVCFNCQFGDVQQYEEAIITALHQQPVVMDVSCSKELIDYRRGTIRDWTILLDERSQPIFHSMVIVGAIVLKGENVWVVRNSWGKKWGRKGCLYIHRRLTKYFVEVSYPIIN